MDDITLTGPDPEALAEAFLWLQEQLVPTKLLFNAKKCEFFGGIHGKQLPESLKCVSTVEGVPVSVAVVLGCIKVLGAFIGSKDAIIVKLREKLEKHSIFFSRLKTARPDTRTGAILATCALPRHSYQLRTHSPDETDEMSLEFDALVDEVLEVWFDVPRDDTVGQEVLHLPRSAGGVGFVRTNPTRAGSYNDSRYKALLSLDKNFREVERPPASKSAVDDLYYANKVKKLAEISPLVRRHLEENKRRGAKSWIFAASCKVTPMEYATAVRSRALARSGKLPTHCHCFGCNKDWSDQVLYNIHVQGCASSPVGENSNTKHNHIVREFIGALLEKGKAAGKVFSFELEPRKFGLYTCRRCHERDIRPCDVKAHVARCGGDPLRTGPDIEVHWAVGDRVVYDYTTLHLTCSTKLECSPETSIKRVTSTKVAKYVTSGQVAAKEFQVVVGFSSGGVSEELYTLLSRAAKAAGRSPEDVVREYAVLVQRDQAHAVVLSHQANDERLRWDRK